MNTTDPASAPEAPRKTAANLGRPSTKRVAAIDSAIPRVALELFLEHGFEAVTMDMISTRAHISKRTLYTRYASKIDVLSAALRFQVDAWVAREKEKYQSLPADIEERLRHHARLIVTSQGWDEVRKLGRLIASVSAAYPEVTAVIYQSGLKTVVEHLGSDLQAAGSRENLGDADWPFLAQAFFHAIFGWHSASSMVRTLSEAEITEYCDKVVALTLTGAQRKPET